MVPNVLVLATDVLFTHFFSQPTLDRLSEVAQWTRYSQREDSSHLRDSIAESDALITTWHSPFLTPEMLSKTSKVKLIAHCGGEVKARIAEPLFDYLTVTNAPEPMASVVAEMALTLMLSLVRRVHEYAAEMRAGVVRTNEDVSEGETIRGRRIGLVGFGRIGQAFAQLVKPLGAELLVYDPYCTVEAVTGIQAKLVGLDELVRTSSVVVLAAALTEETRNLFDAKRLSFLSNGSYLINVARGGLIDTNALIVELRKGRLTAALDVTDPVEPLPVDHELRRLPNVLLTPHIAAGGIETRRAMGCIAVEEVIRFTKGEAPRNRVTREMLRTMT
ncbi:MAG: hydroxyacid dehydrogenase [Pyrinomonadaceae bacterium]